MRNQRPAALKRSLIGEGAVLAAGDNIGYASGLWTPHHRLIANLMWDLPVGVGQRFLNRRGWPNYVLGGWQITTTRSSACDLNSIPC
jgi:hypothetical protein